MPEEVLFEKESPQSREKVASYFRRFAGALEAGRGINLTSDEQSVTVSPPAQVDFEVEVERAGPADGPGEVSIEFEIEWDEG